MSGPRKPGARPDGSAPGRPAEEAEELPSLSLDDVVSEPIDLGALADLLGDRYAPVAVLGEGTFGEVIRARDAVLGREVAVKRVRLEAFSAPGQLEQVKARFLREAQVAAQLRHPNIVTTHDIVSGTQASFIVMELVDGRDLQSLLQERGALGLEETLDVIGQVAAALDHAHENGIVHRDIKPANIMIERSGHVKVMDFGIAKVEQGGSRTSTGVILGTPNYMSPEQARGHKVDARADVFSLGCVLYECLSGTRPFHDESVTSILLKVVTEPAPPIDFEARGLPRALDGVLQRAMAKEPERRFASPGALVAAAREAARGVEVAPRPVAPTGTLVSTPGGAATPVVAPARPESTTGTPDSPRAARRSLALPLAALAVIVVGGGILGIVQQGSDAAVSPPRAADGRLVVEEELGFFGRLLGREPRLFITVPGGTTLPVEIQTPISTATTRPRAKVAATLERPVVIEGQEAFASGAAVEGRAVRVESAEDGDGRGRLTLEFSSVTLPGGARVRIESDPVELVAPPPRPRKSRRGGLAGAWDKVTSTVGEIVRDVQAQAAGGVSGAQAVEGQTGVDVQLPSGSTLDVSLTRDVTIVRTKAPEDRS